MGLGDRRMISAVPRIPSRHFWADRERILGPAAIVAFLVKRGTRSLSEVATALGVERVSLAEIGRRRIGCTAVKHHIKRTWRSLASRRVEPSQAIKGVIEW